MQPMKVGFIGGGQMAAALISGAVGSGFLSHSNLVIVENSPQRRQWLVGHFPEIQVTESLEAMVKCQSIVLAVKPQVLRDIGSNLAKQLAGDRLWVSIAAGVNLAELQAMLGSRRLIRVMPNTPAQVGAGAAAISPAHQATEADIAWVSQLMNSVGNCVSVPEPLMHAVTGIAGSSPAYVYLIIEALSDAGVAGGLSRETAVQLAAQSVLGAAKMVLETGTHPAQLKDQVTSPAGTTIAALRQLEARGLRSALLEAVDACICRSKELEQAARS